LNIWGRREDKENYVISRFIICFHHIRSIYDDQIKSRSTRAAGLVARMGDMKNLLGISVDKN
jgi:hypothetical protein